MASIATPPTNPLSSGKQPDWTLETTFLRRSVPLPNSPYPWLTAIANYHYANKGRLPQVLIDAIVERVVADYAEGALMAEAAGLCRWDNEEKDWLWLTV